MELFYGYRVDGGPTLGRIVYNNVIKFICDPPVNQWGDDV